MTLYKRAFFAFDNAIWKGVLELKKNIELEHKKIQLLCNDLHRSRFEKAQGRCPDATELYGTGFFEASSNLTAVRESR